MAVRCKFRCESRTETAGGVSELKLTAVTGSNSEEDKKFWKWTPSGELKFQCVNAEAAAEIQPGKCYYLDITPAE